MYLGINILALESIVFIYVDHGRIYVGHPWSILYTVQYLVHTVLLSVML